MDRYTEKIIIEGLVDQAHVDTVRNRQYVGVFHPTIFKSMATQNSPWISVDWSNISELRTTTSSSLTSRTVSALSSIKNVLTNLTLENPAEPGAKKWISQPMTRLTEIEYKVSKAFRINLANARGRQMVYCVLELLFADCSDIAVTNIGGGGTIDPNIKMAQLEFTITPAILSQGESSPDNSPPSKLETAQKGSRKRLLTEDIPSPKRVCKIPPWLDEELSLPTVNKNFVPDMLVEKFNNLGDIVEEILNVSVKRGFHLTEKDHAQIKFELLPVLSRQSRALGLLICAGDAYLYLITLVGNDIQISRKHYSFTKDLLFNVFCNICHDILTYE